MSEFVDLETVVLFSTRMCSYCVRAKRLLEKNHIPFKEHDISTRSDIRSWLIQQTGRYTVPQIFVKGQPIGGYVELEAMVRRGDLAELVERTPV